MGVHDGDAYPWARDVWRSSSSPEGVAGTRPKLLGLQVLAATRWLAIRLEGRLGRVPLENDQPS